MRIRQAVKRSMFGSREAISSPAAVSGLVGYWAADSGVYQDGAAQFTSSHSDYLSIASNSTLQTGVDFWIAAWVYLDSTGSATFQVAKHTGTAAASEFSLAYSGTRFRLNVFVGSTTYTADANTFGAPSTSTWYFVMGYWDATNNAVKVSVNGGAFDSTSTTGTVNTTATQFVLGASSVPSSYHNGRLDSVGFGKSPPGGIAAIATTIRDSLYNSGIGKLYADLTSQQKTDWGLVSWWDLGEETGTRFDSHGTNHLAENLTDRVNASTLNGGFETAGGGGADVFGSWTEAATGTSTITRDTTNQRTGAACAAIAHDGSGSLASLSQAVMVVGRRYYVSVYAKADSTTGTPVFRVGNSFTELTMTLTTSYAQYSTVFLARETTFLLARNTGCANRTVYLDDVELKPVDIPGTAGIAASLAVDVNFAASLNGTTQYMQDPGTGGDYDVNGQNVVLGAWVYLNHKSNATPHVISKYQNGFNRNYRVWYDVSADRFNFGVYNTGATASQELAANTHGAVSIGTWYLVVCYYDTGGTMGISVNGGAFDTTAVAFSPTSGGGNFVLGQDGLLLNGWPGRIDSVSFSRPTSATATRAASIASAMYNGGLGAKYSQVSVAANWGLMHWWDNEESSGSHVNKVTTGQDLVNTGSITRLGGVNYLPGLVSKWVDQSSSALNWVQTTASKRPAYFTSGMNGRPALWFDGVDDVMTVASAGALSTNAQTIFAVLTSAAGSGTRIIVEASDANHYVAITSTPVVFTAHRNTATTLKNTSGPNCAGSKVIAARWTIDGSTNPTVDTWVNTTTAQTAYADGTTAPSATTYYLGAIAPGTGNLFDGYLSELAVYNASLSDTDVASVISYLRTKYAI